MQENLQNSANESGNRIQKSTYFFSGYANVFNIVDSSKEFIHPHSFCVKELMLNEKIALLYEHDFDQPVGKINYLKQDNYGLYIEGEVHTQLPAGKKLIYEVLYSKISSFSIGYTIEQYAMRSKVRHIFKLHLIEISFTANPVNDKARLITMVDIYNDHEINMALDRLGNALLLYRKDSVNIQ